MAIKIIAVIIHWLILIWMISRRIWLNTLISNKVRNIVFCIFYCNLLQFYRESFCLICKQCRDYLLVTEIYLIYPQIFVKQEMEITCAVIIFDQKLIKIFKHLVHREENERCVPTLFIGREETRARTLAREFMPICLVPSYAAESHSPAPLSRFWFVPSLCVPRWSRAARRSSVPNFVFPSAMGHERVIPS